LDFLTEAGRNIAIGKVAPLIFVMRRNGTAMWTAAAQPGAVERARREALFAVLPK
jgi:hypothetical protein